MLAILKCRSKVTEQGRVEFNRSHPKAKRWALTKDSGDKRCRQVSDTGPRVQNRHRTGIGQPEFADNAVSNDPRREDLPQSLTSSRIQSGRSLASSLLCPKKESFDCIVCIAVRRHGP